VAVSSYAATEGAGVGIDYRAVSVMINLSIVSPMPKKSKLRTIRDEIAAMPTEQLLADVMAMAGSWADLEDITDDGIGQMPWGFIESTDTDEANPSV
jgi:hypothetical protein